MRKRILESGTYLENIKKFARNEIVLIVLVFLIILFGCCHDVFFTVNNILNIGRQLAQLAIISCGMTMLIIGGNIDLSVGSTYSLAGVLGALVMQLTKSWILGILAALSIGIIVGFINGILTAKGKIPSFLTTLATMGIIRGISMIITGTKDVLVFEETYLKIFSDGTLFRVPSQIFWLIIVAGISIFILNWTTLGKYIYAIGGNRVSARFCGLNVDRIIISLFIMGGIFAALSGMIQVSLLHAARPSLGYGLELNAIAATILGGTSLHGGIGKIRGTIIGALTVTVLNNGLLLFGLRTFVQQIIVGIVIILAILFIRRGE